MSLGPYNNPEEIRRTVLTLSCRDTDDLPRVANAGEIAQTDGITVQIMHNGLRVAYHADSETHIMHGLRGHIEPQQARAFHGILKYCRPRSCILELGAAWAYYSMWYLKAVPFSSAYCLEPSPKNLARGQINMRLNGLQAAFLHASIGGTYAEAQAFVADGGQRITLPQHTVQTAMTHFGLEEVELLHMDIDGGELVVLKSCVGLVALNKLRFLVVSTHHRNISKSFTTHQDCLDCLLDCRAHIVCEHTPDEAFGGDGLIVAAARPEDRLIPEISVSRCRGVDPVTSSHSKHRH